MNCQRDTLWYTIMNDMKNMAVKMKRKLYMAKILLVEDDETIVRTLKIEERR